MAFANRPISSLISAYRDGIYTSAEVFFLTMESAALKSDEELGDELRVCASLFLSEYPPFENEVARQDWIYSGRPARQPQRQISWLAYFAEQLSERYPDPLDKDDWGSWAAVMLESEALSEQDVYDLHTTLIRFSGAVQICMAAVPPASQR